MPVMNKVHAALYVAGGVVLAVLVFAGVAQVAEVEPPAPGPPPVAPESNPASPDQASAPEVLTRGPIHEAFAAPITTGGLKPLTVPKAPPPPVEEVPPDVKPEEEGAVWIPGYWAWDDDRKDFIWVSGVWRVPPAGSTWVAGYWTQVDGGWRWVPGFWTSADSQEATYYPEPPESLEQGPTSEPASPDYFWVPGCWEWRGGRYVWRAGYWAVIQPDWVWVPASYCWSPRGWVFVAGYWDYPFWRRGVLFAPVWFHRPVWRIGYVYRPAVVVDIGVVTLHLFARPICYHYYFGDYYAPVYETWGFYPWFSVHRHRYYHYDPLFVYSRWYYHHHDPRWESHLRGWHRYFREHEDLRPPRTLAQQRTLDQRLKARRELDPQVARTVASTVSLAAPAHEFRKRPDALVRLTELPPAARERAQLQARELRNVAVQRRQIEVESASRAALPKLPASKPAGVAPGDAGSRVKAPKTGVESKTGDSKPSIAAMPKPGGTPGASQPQRGALPRLPKLSGPADTASTGPAGPGGTGSSPPVGETIRPPTGRVRPGLGTTLPSAPKPGGVPSLKPGGIPSPKPGGVPSPKPSGIPTSKPGGIPSPKPAGIRSGPSTAPRGPSMIPKPLGDEPGIQPRPGVPRLPVAPSVPTPPPQFRRAAAPSPPPPSFRRPPAPTRSKDSDASADQQGTGGPGGGRGGGKR